MSWSLRVRRLAISAFVVFHIFVLTVWNIPTCVIRDRIAPTLAYYVQPLGLWQNWSMFAPDPVRHTVAVEATAIDAKGLVYTFAFPKMADFGFWQRIPRVRHSKYASYFMGDENKVNREIAACHVVRELKIPTDHFPVEMELVYRIRETPPFGKAPDDAMTPLTTLVLQAYRFPSPQEVHPWP